MSSLAEQVAERVKAFPADQQQEVLHYVEFLETKLHLGSGKESAVKEPRISMEGAMKKYAGCLDSGPSDLSYNKVYMKDFGRDSIETDQASPEKRENEGSTPISFAEAAREYIGCLEGGPEDLSCNRAYLQE